MQDVPCLRPDFTPSIDHNTQDFNAYLIFFFYIVRCEIVGDKWDVPTDKVEAMANTHSLSHTLTQMKKLSVMSPTDTKISQIQDIFL